MRSQKLLKKLATFSAGFIKRYLRLFILSCCVGLFPSFGLLADSSLPTIPLLNTTNPASYSISSVPNMASSEVSARTKIYFYNPEINTARNLVLKNTWDKYLYEVGNYEFQPVDNGEDFKKLFHEEQNAAFIMAEWLYTSFFSTSDLDIKNIEIAFRGIKNGEETYRKILVANKNSLDFEKVTIACSGSKVRAYEVLKSIYPELSTQQLENLKILLVPKDIDALMTVGYGLSDMALTTEQGLLKMALLNKHIYKDMIIVKESKPLGRSVLAVKSSNNELKVSLANALINMRNHSNGQQAMGLLGLDEWKGVGGFSALNTKNTIDSSDNKGGQQSDN